ncbi:MAG TPA: hypothetical protein VHM90_01365 [Phycisphaerae bacterium]|nr:hypothetical protein [Phycisphaerae bacterium]
MVHKEQNIGQKRLGKALLVTIPVLMVTAIGWWGIRKLDPTHSAIYISDSPDGKYRCAVFAHGSLLGNSGPYEVALFQGQWPHHELAGARIAWNHDSVDSSNFRCTWHANSVEFDCRNGLGDEHETFLGTDAAAKQVWTRP